MLNDQFLSNFLVGRTYQGPEVDDLRTELGKLSELSRPWVWPE